ncbi:hypothetical protein JCM11641_005550 [Rhodosporidiobolus odoratus]
MLRSTSSAARLAARQTLSTASTSRSYASKASPASSGSRKKANATLSRGSRPGEGAGDSRVEAIKSTLYESDPSEASRLEALRRAIPSPEVHETITRAWLLHQRTQRLSHSSELARKYSLMREAIDLLEQTDKGMWEQAVGGKKFQNVRQDGRSNARLEGIVPREYRVPTERPGAVLWDSEWKAPKREEQR